MILLDSKKVRDALIDCGLNCRDIAAKAGLSSSTLMLLKAKDSRAHYKTLHKLARVLNVTPRDLVKKFKE